MKKLLVGLAVACFVGLSGCLAPTSEAESGDLLHRFEATYEDQNGREVTYELAGSALITAPWGERVTASPLKRILDNPDEEIIEWIGPEGALVRTDELCFFRWNERCETNRIAYYTYGSPDDLGLVFRDLSIGDHSVPFDSAYGVHVLSADVVRDGARKIVRIDGSSAPALSVPANVTYVFEDGVVPPVELYEYSMESSWSRHLRLRSWEDHGLLERGPKLVPVHLPQEKNGVHIPGDDAAVAGYGLPVREIMRMFLDLHPDVDERLEAGACLAQVSLIPSAATTGFEMVERYEGRITVTVVDADGVGPTFTDHLLWNRLDGYKLEPGTTESKAPKTGCHTAESEGHAVTIKEVIAESEDILSTSKRLSGVSFYVDRIWQRPLPESYGWTQFIVSATPGFVPEEPGAYGYPPDQVAWNSERGWYIEMSVSNSDYQRLTDSI